VFDPRTNKFLPKAVNLTSLNAFPNQSLGKL
jgi:hypothetical protein